MVQSSPTTAPTSIGASDDNNSTDLSPQCENDITGTVAEGHTGEEGIIEVGRPSQSTTQEDLAEQGMPTRQASHAMVRQNENEVIQQLFGAWIMCFFSLLCCMIPFTVAIQCWALVEYIRFKNVVCDVPLRTWFLTHVIVHLIHNLGVAKFAAKCFCGWPDPQNPRPMPCLLKVYNIAMPAFMFVWNCLGLHWVATDGSGNTYPACKEAAPGLYISMYVYSVLNILATGILVIFFIGPSCVLIFATRRGLLRSPQAAPKGTIEKVTTPVAMDDPAINELVECSICMVKYSEGDKSIVKTKCGHIFHKACLKNWLEHFKGNCPLCREEFTN